VNLIKKVITTVIEIIMTEYRVLCVMTRKLHSYVTSPVLGQENVTETTLLLVILAGSA